MTEFVLGICACRIAMFAWDFAQTKRHYARIRSMNNDR